MKRIWLVLVREYLENVRTKAFLIGIILTPLWFGMVFVVPLLAKGQEAETQHVVLVDETGVLGHRDPAGPRRAPHHRRGARSTRWRSGTRRARGPRQASAPSLVDRLRAQAAEGRAARRSC